MNHFPPANTDKEAETIMLGCNYIAPVPKLSFLLYQAISGVLFYLVFQKQQQKQQRTIKQLPLKFTPHLSPQHKVSFFSNFSYKKKKKRKCQVYELSAKLSEPNSAGYLQVRFKDCPAWTTCCVPFILNSGTLNFDPELDPRKTKKRKNNQTLTMTNHSLPSPLTFMMLQWKGKAKKMRCPPHRTYSLPAVLTQDSHNLPQELLRKESRNETYASFSQRLCSQIVPWADHKQSSGPCSYISNQGSMPSSTTGCISLGNTTMTAPSMARAKVGHFHGKSHILTSKILSSCSSHLLESSERSEKGLRIFPSWLKVPALLLTVPH